MDVDDIPPNSFAPINSPYFNEFFRNMYLRNIGLYEEQFRTANCAGAFGLQVQQIFVAEYINDDTPYRGLLLWHGLGSGKTCSSINIANHVKSMSKTILLGASLVENFKDDYSRPWVTPISVDGAPRFPPASARLRCGDLTAGEIKYYTNNVPDNKKQPLSNINNKFNIVTSNGVVQYFKSDDDYRQFEDSLIIIDESQILVSKIVNSIQALAKAELNLAKAPEREFFERKVKRKLNNPFYQLYLHLRKLENAKIVCLSGTPVVNTPFELAVLFNIIHGDIVSWKVNSPPQKPLDETITKHIFTIKDEQFIYKCPSKFINTTGHPGYVSRSSDAISNDAFESLLKTYYGEVTRQTTPLFTESADDFNKLSLDAIQSRIIGLTSYFSNIESLFPNIIIPRDYGCIIGDSNEKKPLFCVKKLELSDYQKELQRIIDAIANITSKIIINDKAIVTENIVTESIKSIRLNSIQQFAYPGLLEYLTQFTPAMLQSEDFQFVTAVDVYKRKQPNTGESEDKRARVAIAGPLEERFAAKILQNMRGPSEERAASGLLGLGMDMEKMNTSSFNGGGYVRNYTNLYKHPVYKELSDYKSAIWTPPPKDGVIPEGHPLNSLRLPALQMYSPKMASIIETILANLDKLHIVYSEFLQDNIPFIRALQLNGGFTQFSELALPSTPGNRYVLFTGCSSGSSKPGEDIYETGQYNPELLVGNEGKCLNEKIRKKQLEVFKQNENKNGQYIQVIIINSAAAEGISMKNIRYVHFLSKPPTMSKLFQIIGRGRRNCSHKELPEGDKNITPILYLMPDEVATYEKMVTSNNTFLPYLSMLKQSSIDCALSKNAIVDSSITSCAIAVPPAGGRKHNYTKKYIRKNKTRKYKKGHYKKSRKYKKVKKTFKTTF